MKILTIAFVICSIYSYFVFAAGTMQLEGSVVSVTANKLELNDGYHTYSLLKNKLVTNKHINFAKLKPGQKISLTIPFDAVDTATSIIKK